MGIGSLEDKYNECNFSSDLDIYKDYLVHYYKYRKINMNLIDMIKKYLPTFDYEMRYYPIDEYTDKNLRHMCAEIIREKALLCLDDEIPHGIQVVVVDYQEIADPTTIYADIYCEKDSHKAIILGKNGDMIKKISSQARMSIEKVIGEKFNLQVYVKVKSNWRNDIKAITEVGLNSEE